MSKSNTGRGRTRSYATLVYPESAPENWMTVLSDLVVPALVSPLHDHDLTDEGTLKKPHYHVMLLFDSVKTPAQAQEVFDKIGGVGCEAVRSVKAHARYLCHLDHPDKAQYNQDDVRQFGGACFYDLVQCVIDHYTALAEIMDFCDDNQIYSFRNLLHLCRMEHFEWFRALCDGGSYIVKEYLKTANWEDNAK